MIEITFPEAHEIYQYESYTLGLTLIWDITHAQKIHREHWKVYTTDVRPLAEQLARGLAEVDITHAMSDAIDLTRPLIAARMPTTDELILIDGWHRVYRAAHDGVAELPLVVLTDDEERDCRLAPTDEQIRRARARRQP